MSVIVVWRLENTTQYKQLNIKTLTIVLCGVWSISTSIFYNHSGRYITRIAMLNNIVTPPKCHSYDS